MVSGRVLYVLVISRINAFNPNVICDDVQYVSDLDEIERHEDGFSAFFPPTYRYGGSTKFISSNLTSIEDRDICVDGETIFNDSVRLYDDGTHGDDVAGDGIFSRSCVYLCDAVFNSSPNPTWLFSARKTIHGAHIMSVDPHVGTEIPNENSLIPPTAGNIFSMFRSLSTLVEKTKSLITAHPSQSPSWTPSSQLSTYPSSFPSLTSNPTVSWSAAPSAVPSSMAPTSNSTVFTIDLDIDSVLDTITWSFHFFLWFFFYPFYECPVVRAIFDKIWNL